MSQSDSFIDEVTEEVRRDRLFALMKRYGWIAILIVVVVVGGAAWNEYSKSQAEAEARAMGDALLSAMEQGSPEERVAALGAIDTANPGQTAVRDMLEASEAAASGDKAAGADRLMALSRTEGLEPIYRDLARFKALNLTAGTATPEERRKGYEELAVPGGSLRLLAEEQIALTYLEEGDSENAVKTLRSILDDAEVTPGLRQRVSQLMVSLGETPASESDPARTDQ